MWICINWHKFALVVHKTDATPTDVKNTPKTDGKDDDTNDKQNHTDTQQQQQQQQQQRRGARNKKKPKWQNKDFFFIYVLLRCKFFIHELVLGSTSLS